MIINKEHTDGAGGRWLIIEAKSLKAAENEIAMARCTGSVGGKSVKKELVEGKWKESLIAHVNRLNEDGTLRRPG